MIEVDLLPFLCLAAAFSLIFVGVVLIVAYAKQPSYQDVHHQESSSLAEDPGKFNGPEESPGLAEDPGKFDRLQAKPIISSTSRSVNNFHLGGGVLSSVLGSLIVGYVLAPTSPQGHIERGDVSWEISDYPSQTNRFKSGEGDGNQQASNRGQSEIEHLKKEFEDLINQGIQYELEKQPDLAFERYKEALTQRYAPLGQAAQAMSRMAQIRLDQGYSDEAIQLAYVAVGLDSESSLYRNTLARILIKHCQIDEAEKELDQISDDNPATDDVRLALAETRRRTCSEG